jgi:hypothetical protein
MGTTDYKFTFPPGIDMPESIEFDGIRADIETDFKGTDGQGNFEISGEVDDTALDSEGKLPVFVTSSGRTGRTWKMWVKWEKRQLKEYPIKGTIGNNGFCNINNKYKVTPTPPGKDTDNTR